LLVIPDSRHPFPFACHSAAQRRNLLFTPTKTPNRDSLTE